jgi:hypothetical protein
MPAVRAYDQATLIGAQRLSCRKSQATCKGGMVCCSTMTMSALNLHRDTLQALREFSCTNQ